MKTLKQKPEMNNKMKRISILISAILCLLLHSCNGKFEEKWPGLKIDFSEYTLDLEGGRFMVYVYYDGAWTMTLPEDVTWARIENGEGSGVGFAYVVYDTGVPQDRSATVTVTADNGESTTIVLNQGKRIISSIRVTLDKTQVAMVHDEEVVLTATVLPADTTYPEVTWSSSDESIATVENGRIIACGAGEVTITASNGACQASCTVTISAPVRGLSFKETSISMFEGGLYRLTPLFNPVFAENQEIVWSSSDEEVVTVDGGLVKALKLGNAVITATSVDGSFKAECAVTVQESTIIDVPDFGGNGEGFKDDDYNWEN